MRHELPSKEYLKQKWNALPIAHIDLKESGKAIVGDPFLKGFWIFFGVLLLIFLVAK